jgi:hypothetical protein
LTKKNSLTPARWARDRRQIFKWVVPYLGNKPIGSIEAPDLLEVLKRIETKGATPRPPQNSIGQVYGARNRNRLNDYLRSLNFIILINKLVDHNILVIMKHKRLVLVQQKLLDIVKHQKLVTLRWPQFKKD